MKTRHALLLNTPLTLLNVAVFAMALAYVVWISLATGAALFENYATVIQDPLFHIILTRTIWLSVLASAISVVLGYIIAFHMWVSSPRMRAFLTLIVISPLLISVVVRTFGWMLLFGSSGMIAQMLDFLGVRNSRLLYTVTGVVIALVHVHLPYAVLSILTSLDNINSALLRASSSLGATSTKVFSSVILPLTMPGIVAAGMLTFVLNMGSFVTPIMIGGPRQLTLGGYVHQEIMIFFHEGPGFAASVLTLVLIVAITAIATRLFRTRQNVHATGG